MKFKTECVDNMHISLAEGDRVERVKIPIKFH